MKLNFSKIITHKIRGKIFHMIWRRPRGKPVDPEHGDCWAGECDNPDPRKTPAKCRNIRIMINGETDHTEILGTVIHELTHAAFFDLEDGVVVEFEHDLMRLLRRMGIEVKFNPK